MDIEFEARVEPLEYKVKAMSRESSSQKAGHVLGADLRSHWSTATNTKEWILLKLNEPCLLSHIRIYNKSVLEWEISVGLRYKLLKDVTSWLLVLLPQLECRQTLTASWMLLNLIYVFLLCLPVLFIPYNLGNEGYVPA
ncbi:unnamed protein product [Prunus brigantina]